MSDDELRAFWRTLADAAVVQDATPRVDIEPLLTIRFTDDGDSGWTAQIVELPAAISQGATREQARSNVIAALSELLTGS